jgi:hypothetical protein
MPPQLLLMSSDSSKTRQREFFLLYDAFLMEKMFNRVRNPK